MGTPAEEPRKVMRAVRFTVREDFEIQRMMKKEDYLSVSKYIRDKALSKTRQSGAAYEQLTRLADKIREVVESYNSVVDLLYSEKGGKPLIKTLIGLMKELRKTSEKAIILAESMGEGRQINSNIMMQKISIIGKVVADAELKKSKNGSEYVGFTVAVEEKMGEETRVTYYDVWTSRTNIVNWIKKGRTIYVSGKISISAICRDNKAYLNAHVTATDVDFMGGYSESKS